MKTKSQKPKKNTLTPKRAEVTKTKIYGVDDFYSKTPTVVWTEARVCARQAHLLQTGWGFHWRHRLPRASVSLTPEEAVQTYIDQKQAALAKLLEDVEEARREVKAALELRKRISSGKLKPEEVRGSK